MFWDNDEDSDMMQRFKNQAIFKVPLNNKERDAALPGMAVIGVVVMIAALIWWLIR